MIFMSRWSYPQFRLITFTIDKSSQIVYGINLIAQGKGKGEGVMGENIKRNVLLLVVVVIAALLVLACADPGIPPGTKIRIRSGSPAPRGSELASHTGVPDSDSDSNISDTDPNPTPAPVSMKASEELVN